jgi:hypothetical protein
MVTLEAAVRALVDPMTDIPEGIVFVWPDARTGSTAIITG